METIELFLDGRFKSIHEIVDYDVRIQIAMWLVDVVIDGLLF